MKSKSFVFFFPYFFVAIVALNIIWFSFVYGKLYYCSDPLFFPFMFPPLAHEGVVGDYYVAPASIVDSLGIIFNILIFVIPLIGAIVTAKKLHKKS